MLERTHLRALGVAAGFCAVLLTVATAGTASGSVRSTDLLAKIKASHTLTVASSNDPPILYANKSGKPVGMVYDVLRAVLNTAGLQNVKIKPIYVPFSSIIPALDSGRVDLIADTMAITPARMKQMHFTLPIFNNQETVVVYKGNPLNIHSYKAVAGHACGTYLGTIWVPWCKAVGASSTTDYPTETALVAAVAAKRLDAAFIDILSAGYLIRENPNLPAEVANPYTPRYAGSPANYVSIGGVRKDAASASLLKLEDQTLIKLRNNGTLAKIVAKWGYPPASTLLPAPDYYMFDPIFGGFAS